MTPEKCKCGSGRRIIKVPVIFLVLIGLMILWTGCGSRESGSGKNGDGSRTESAAAGNGARTRLLVIGLDGADWQVFDKLIREGKAPAMEALVKKGVKGDLRAEPPLQSPPIWNTIATGVSREKHGITTFMQDPGNGTKVPVTTRMRKRKAFWNIFTDYGISTGVVAWWPTWPAEHIKGYVVSQRAWPVRFSQNGVPFGAVRDRNQKPVIPEFSYRTWPEALFEQFRPFIVTEDMVSLPEILRFVDWDEDPALLSRKFASNPELGRKLFNLVWVYARDKTFYEAGLEFLRKYPTEVFAVYFEGTDVVGHYFWQYRPEEKFNLPEEEQSLFAPIVDEYYIYTDGLVGDLVDAAGDDVDVVIVSDHGFETKWDLKPLWEKGEKIDVEGGMGVPWHHADNGVILAAGPSFREGAEIDGASIYDVTPTILPVMNVPLGRDMEGVPLTEAYRPGAVELTWIDSHERHGGGARKPPAGEGSPVDARFEEKLKSLGYIE